MSDQRSSLVSDPGPTSGTPQGADAHLEGGNGFTFGLLYHQAVAADPDAELAPATKNLRKAIKGLAQ